MFKPFWLIVYQGLSLGDKLAQAFVKGECYEVRIRIGPLGAPGGERMIELAKEGENLGYDTIWCPEIYGADCFTPLAWVGAHTSKINLGTSIMQISARTPASAAMHAVALDYLSNGRLILGIGVSGPQVVEGGTDSPIQSPWRERGNGCRFLEKS